MIREYLSETTLAVWPLAAFVLFFLTFLTVLAAIAISVIRKKNFDYVAGLPLEADGAVAGKGDRDER